MKKITAMTVSLLLGIMMITGCSTQTNTSTPVPSATPVKVSVDPTANIDTTLNQDTLYDQDYFSVVIPKDAKLTKTGQQYIWTIGYDKLIIQFQIVAKLDPLKTTDITESETSLNSIIDYIEAGTKNALKMDVGYKKITIGGKTAILLTGNYTQASSVNGTVSVYLVDATGGMMFVSAASVNTNGATQAEMDAVENKILNTLIIK